jgi:hypothetical protein
MVIPHSLAAYAKVCRALSLCGRVQSVLQKSCHPIACKCQTQYPTVKSAACNVLLVKLCIHVPVWSGRYDCKLHFLSHVAFRTRDSCSANLQCVAAAAAALCDEQPRRFGSAAIVARRTRRHCALCCCCARCDVLEACCCVCPGFCVAVAADAAQHGDGGGQGACADARHSSRQQRRWLVNHTQKS